MSTNIYATAEVFDCKTEGRVIHLSNELSIIMRLDPKLDSFLDNLLRMIIQKCTPSVQYPEGMCSISVHYLSATDWVNVVEVGWEEL